MKRFSTKDIIFYILIVLFAATIVGMNYYHVWRFPMLNSRSYATEHEFDVIVVGAEPEGITAAIAASRSGAKVLLIDRHADVGGLLTYGMLNTLDMNHGARRRLVTKGLFYEFYRQLEGSSFDVKHAQKVLHDMVANEPNITFWNKTKFIKPLLSKDNQMLGIEVIKDGKTRQVYTDRVIDATQDADVAFSAGVPFMYGAPDRGHVDQTMAATLVFGIKNVDWDKIVNLLRHDGDPLTGADRFSAWGFLDEMRKYRSISQRIRMRGLNMGRQRDGTVLINALLIYDVNGTSALSRANAISVAKQEIPNVVEFIRQKVVGCKNAKLSLIAPELYVRETRHMIGEYRLTINDVLENRDKWDRIAIGSYPVDIQAMSHENLGFIIGKPVQYSIPFRCLVPIKVENLLVVGRSASYWSAAMGSARVVPVGMCEGEAAGVAATYSIWKNISFRKMSQDTTAIKDLQDILEQRGAYLQPFNIFNPNTLHWSYPALRVLLPTGIVQGKYTNNYHFENSITEKQFFNLASDLLRVLKGEEYAKAIDKSYGNNLSQKYISSQRAAYYLLLLNGYKRDIKHSKDLVLLAKEKGLLSPLVLSHGFGGEKVSFAQTYEVLSHMYKNLYPKSSNPYAPPPENGNENSL